MRRAEPLCRGIRDSWERVQTEASPAFPLEQTHHQHTTQHTPLSYYCQDVITSTYSLQVSYCASEPLPSRHPFTDPLTLPFHPSADVRVVYGDSPS